MTLQATSAGDLRLAVRAPGLASTLPVIYAPTTPAAARNGQRVAVPTSQVVVGSGGGSATKTQIQVASTATPATVVVGGTSRDLVTVRNAAPTFKVSAGANLFGPFRSQAEISCDGTPFWTGTLPIAGSGDYTTSPVKLDQTGWYVYQHDIPDDANHLGVTTSCKDPKERLRVVAAPTVYTVVSAQTAEPGAQIFDTVNVTGLAGEKATVRAALYGPFASAKAISCGGKPLWTGTINVTADGEYQTAKITLAVAGYYTYHESIDTGEFVRGAQTRCGETTETTVVGGVHTLVSAEVVFPGASIFDRIQVLGLGKSARIEVELFGPYAARAAITCSGAPYWRGTVIAHGDGIVSTPPVRLAKAGFYTFRERVAGSSLKTECAEVAETALARPLILTGRGDPVLRVRAVAASPPAADEGARPVARHRRARLPRLDQPAPRSARRATADPPAGLVAGRDGSGLLDRIDVDRRPRRQRKTRAGRIQPAARGAPGRLGAGDDEERPDADVPRRLGAGDAQEQAADEHLQPPWPAQAGARHLRRAVRPEHRPLSRQRRRDRRPGLTVGARPARGAARLSRPRGRSSVG